MPADTIAQNKAPGVNPLPFSLWTHKSDKKSVAEQDRAAKAMAHKMHAFRTAWNALKHPDDLERLLRNFNLTPLQALHWIGDAWATQVPLELFHAWLKFLAELELPYKIQVRNSGVKQTYVGVIRSFKANDQGIRIFDEGFELHIDSDSVHSAWIVTKPIGTGFFTSLELYNHAGNLAVQFSAQPEKENHAVWQDIISAIPLSGG